VAHTAALISISVALSHIPAYTMLPRIQDWIALCGVCLFTLQKGWEA